MFTPGTVFLAFFVDFMSLFNPQNTQKSPPGGDQKNTDFWHFFYLFLAPRGTPPKSKPIPKFTLFCPLGRPRGYFSLRNRLGDNFYTCFCSKTLVFQIFYLKTQLFRRFSYKCSESCKNLARIRQDSGGTLLRLSKEPAETRHPPARLQRCALAFIACPGRLNSKGSAAVFAERISIISN